MFKFLISKIFSDLFYNLWKLIFINMQVSWQTIWSRIEYLHNLFSYLLQINLYLWSKIPQIPRYILLPVFLDKNVLCPPLFWQCESHPSRLTSGRGLFSPLFMSTFSVWDFLVLLFLFTGLRAPDHSVLRKQNRGLTVAEVRLAFMMVLVWGGTEWAGWGNY